MQPGACSSGRIGNGTRTDSGEARCASSTRRVSLTSSRARSGRARTSRIGDPDGEVVSEPQSGETNRCRHRMQRSARGVPGDATAAPGLLRINVRYDELSADEYADL